MERFFLTYLQWSSLCWFVENCGFLPFKISAQTAAIWPTCDIYVNNNDRGWFSTLAFRHAPFKKNEEIQWQGGFLFKVQNLFLLCDATWRRLTRPSACLWQIDDDKRKDSTYFRHRGRYDKKVQKTKTTTQKNEGFPLLFWLACVCFSTACHLERAEANGRRLQWNPEDRAQHCKTHDCGAFLEHSSKWTELICLRQHLLKSSLLPNICQVPAQVQQQKWGAKEKENDINLKVKIE